jgi:hypothetical protein
MGSSTIERVEDCTRGWSYCALISCLLDGEFPFQRVRLQYTLHAFMHSRTPFTLPHLDVRHTLMVPASSQ